MDKFVARQNFRRFTHRLGFESDCKTRARLEALLLQEVEKLGADLGMLGEVRKTIASFDALIDTQSRFVALLDTNGQHSASATALLDGLRRTKDLCTRYYERLVSSTNHCRSLDRTEPDPRPQ